MRLSLMLAHFAWAVLNNTDDHRALPGCDVRKKRGKQEEQVYCGVPKNPVAKAPSSDITTQKPHPHMYNRNSLFRPERALTALPSEVRSKPLLNLLALIRIDQTERAE